MTKSIFTSWTFWFGILQIALGAVGLMSGLADQQTSFALVITGMTSIGLRVKTTQPVGWVAS